MNEFDVIISFFQWVSMYYINIIIFYSIQYFDPFSQERRFGTISRLLPEIEKSRGMDIFHHNPSGFLISYYVITYNHTNIRLK